MALMAKAGGTQYPPVPAGIHHAVCYGIYDLGTHHNEVFDKFVRQVLILWELPEVRIDIKQDGHEVNLPRAISKKYTLSLNEKSRLHKDLVSWRGKPFGEQDSFDLKELLGMNCMLQVLHKKSKNNSRVYSDIAVVLPLFGGNKVKTPENDLQWYSLEEADLSSATLPAFTPKWIKEIILSSEEFGGVDTATGEPPPIDDNSLPADDVPF